MQRTFIALMVDPQKEMSDCILKLQNVLGMERIKWVDPGKLHITLRFLGDTRPALISATTRILAETVPEFNSPEIVFRGLGLFRSIRDPRVLWIGMAPSPLLLELKNVLDQKLAGLGFPAEERKFSPHLTLARIKSIKNPDLLKGLLAGYRDYYFQKSRMEKLIYYESILRSRGPEYIPLKMVSFKYAPS
ncbi:RNA 2',3'-cyclic phosphodiesterase [Bacteroidota bacterium]